MSKLSRNKRLILAALGIALILLATPTVISSMYGEYPDLGPGVGQNFKFNYDVTVSISTQHPENFVPDWIKWRPQPMLWYWQATGTMKPVEDGYYEIYWTRHAGVLTTIGKNWIEDQLGDSPSTDPAKWIGLSTSASSPSAAWTQIPTEIVANGLERAAGTYASTGDGAWTISHQFTASGTHTDVQLTGLQWANAGDGNLLCADTMTPFTLSSGEKVTVTWSGSAS